MKQMIKIMITDDIWSEKKPNQKRMEGQSEDMKKDKNQVLHRQSWLIDSWRLNHRQIYWRKQLLNFAKKVLTAWRRHTRLKKLRYLWEVMIGRQSKTKQQRDRVMSKTTSRHNGNLLKTNKEQRRKMTFERKNFKKNNLIAITQCKTSKNLISV